jgi:hypothetical protein
MQLEVALKTVYFSVNLKGALKTVYFSVYEKYINATGCLNIML